MDQCDGRVAGVPEPAVAVPVAAARACTARGPGGGADRHQVTAVRQPRLRGTLCQQARPGHAQPAGNHRHLDHQWYRWAGRQLRRDQPQPVAGTRALGRPGSGRPAKRRERSGGQQHLCLPGGLVARLQRRPAGADGAAQRAGLSGAVPDHGNPQAACPRQWPVRGGGQRPRLQQPGGQGECRPRQGGQPGHRHAGDWRLARRAGGRAVHQPLRAVWPFL